MVTPVVRREAVAHLRERSEMSGRRACRVVWSDRASVRYRARRPDDGDLRARLKELAEERRRFGYRRLHVLLRQEGWAANRKKVQRLYREEKLMVRRRKCRKRALGTRRPMEIPARPGQRWSLDFVADTSISGLRVSRELDTLVRRHGKPEMIVSGLPLSAIGPGTMASGTELTSTAILVWSERNKVAWH